MVDLAALEHQARSYEGASKATNTKRAYKADLDHFVAWRGECGLTAAPAAPKTVALYITDLADGLGLRPSTIQRRLTSIAEAHRAAGMESPTRSPVVQDFWTGIRRQKTVKQVQKSPLKTDDLKMMLAVMDDSLLAARDRALLLLGFAGAFRRSELVALDVEDLQDRAEGLVVTLRRSKTDQEGQGTQKPIPYGRDPRTCPVGAVRAWLAAAGISSGPIFRSVNRHGQAQDGRLSDKAVALVVQRRAGAAALDSSKFSGHSLRAGFATQAALAGAPDRQIMAQTGHKSVSMVHRYIRDANLFVENAVGVIGL